MNGRPLVLAEIVNADDVFVDDVGGQARLLQESGLGFLVRRALFGQNLDRHLAPQHGVLGAVDIRHAPTEEFLDRVFSDARRVFHYGNIPV